MATPNFMGHWEIVPFSWVHCDLGKNGLLLLRTEGTLNMRWQLAASAIDSAVPLSKEYVYLDYIYIRISQPQHS